MTKDKKMKPGKVEKSYSNKTPKTTLEKMSHKERAFIAAANRNDRPDVKGRMKSAREASNLHRERTGRGLKLSEDIVMSGNLGEEEESPMRVFQRRHWNPMYNPVPVPITQTELMQHLRDNPAIAKNILALIEGSQGLRPTEQVEPVEPQMAMELSLFVQVNHQLASQNANQPGRMPRDIPTPPGTLSRKTSYGPTMPTPPQDQSMTSPLEGPMMASSPMLSNDSNMAAPQMERQPRRRHTSFGQDTTLYDMPGYNRNPGPQFMGRSSSTPGNITPGTPFEHDSMIQNGGPQTQMDAMHQNSVLRSPEPQTHMNQVHQSPLDWYAKNQSLPQQANQMPPQQANQFSTQWNQERSPLDMSYASHFLPSQAAQTNAMENHHYNQFAQPSTDDKFFADLIDFNGGGR
ncbi:uncharacterized protein EAE97_009692 [Botrytis byssoidea]|uniref:Uncharacterized protein n=1 Tax=Botrytis byssoidea TaxID=139641 RepID=A0A9P5I5F8_9HELO|nr:uncharacterized protein EAE97_009692 [Botrytis byssoidea]KAF7928850.1 hypothetical protein EAE97_009692 [Botrytis byssoidea]